MGVFWGVVGVFWFSGGGGGWGGGWGQFGKIYPRGVVSLEFFILVGDKGPKKCPRGGVG